MNPTNQQEIAALAQAEKYRADMELMRQLYTREGFYTFFLAQLKSDASRTRAECFDYVNALHERLFGAPKFTDYDSFRNSVKNQLSK